MRKRTLAGIAAAAMTIMSVVIPGSAQADPPGPCGFWHRDGMYAMAYYTNCSYLDVHRVHVHNNWMTPDDDICVGRKETRALGFYEDPVLGAEHTGTCSS
ncbi:hypothetical protein AB5J62_21600 [Amycolatopsis sp. cg5]|uniref:hypothetical protein n=1 Tax=Amycolatopsis sp. cg5 TaxID=3238802 RepID=UPI003526A4A3